MRASLGERLMARVRIEPTGCWIWTGSLRQGYGQIWTSVDEAGRRQLLQAHRASYELARGPIPDGMDLDHLCHQPDQCLDGADCPHRRCVNPDHLKPETRRGNVLRGAGPAAVNARKDCCLRGHPFDGRYLDGRRRCPTCHPEAETGTGSCAQCAGPFVRAGRGRARMFCSDGCRFAFHNARRAA